MNAQPSPTVVPERIPINDLGRHFDPLRPQLEQVAARVIASGHFVLGPHVRAFEDAFARYCGVSSAVGVGNGTDALELALRALGVGRGDRVAMVANAAMYGATAALACGASPCFVDVDPATATMDAAQLEHVLANAALRPRAIIVTHLYGRLADMDRLLPVARAHGVPVVEDCAQAHGAEGVDGRRAGGYGDLGCFSFYPTKNLGALGDGGAVVSNDESLAARVRQLRQYGWSAKYCNELGGGRNSRLDEMQAAFLSSMLPSLDAWNGRRRAIAARYSQGIVHPDICVPEVSGMDYVGHLYVVRTRHRDALQAHLASVGVGAEIHYPRADTVQPVLAGEHAYAELPNTDMLCAQVLSLPCFPELDDAEVQRVIDACNGW